MGVHRNFPNTDAKRNTALFLAKTKKDNTAPAYMALTTNTIARLDVTQVLFSQKIEAKYFALAEQAASTTAKKISQAKTKKLISHFIQGFNNGVGREVLSAPDRAFFHLDINSNSVPSLGKESDITFWGDNLIEGDAIRVAAGGAPMANPTIAELEAEYNIFVNLNSEQSTLKDAYDKAQEAVSNMRVEVDKLILKIWDGVETFYDSEELPSLRRKAREWGVTYVSRHKGVIRGTVTDAANGKPLQSVSVKLIEAEEFTETDAEGNYLFRTSYTGACTLEFKLENYFTQTFKIEIPEGASLTQDAAMRGV